MTRNEATVFLITLASVDAADHDAPGNDGTAGMREPRFPVSFDSFPELLAGTCIDCHQRRVIGRHEQLVIVDGNVANRTTQRF